MRLPLCLPADPTRVPALAPFPMHLPPPSPPCIPSCRSVAFAFSPAMCVRLAGAKRQAGWRGCRKAPACCARVAGLPFEQGALMLATNSHVPFAARAARAGAARRARRAGPRVEQPQQAQLHRGVHPGVVWVQPLPSHRSCIAVASAPPSAGAAATLAASPSPAPRLSPLPLRSSMIRQASQQGGRRCGADARTPTALLPPPTLPCCACTLSHRRPTRRAPTRR